MIQCSPSVTSDWDVRMLKCLEFDVIQHTVMRARRLTVCTHGRRTYLPNELEFSTSAGHFAYILTRANSTSIAARVHFDASCYLHLLSSFVTSLRPMSLPQVYAMLMILVYPVGIPVMFMYLLLKRRDKINPPMLSPETNATICFTYASDSPPPRPKLRRASSSRSMSMAKTLSSPMDRDMNRLIVGTTSDAWPEASPRIRGIMRDEKVRAFTDIERERHASGCGPDSPGSGRGDAATEREQVDFRRE